jgi:hypothetical protein
VIRQLLAAACAFAALGSVAACAGDENYKPVYTYIVTAITVNATALNGDEPFKVELTIDGQSVRKATDPAVSKFVYNTRKPYKHVKFGATIPAPSPMYRLVCQVGWSQDEGSSVLFYSKPAKTVDCSTR